MGEGRDNHGHDRVGGPRSGRPSHWLLPPWDEAMSESLWPAPPAASSLCPFSGTRRGSGLPVCPRPPGGEWRLKYERAVREVDFTKKRLQQEFEDKLEVEQQNKRQLERRVSLPEAAEAWAWEGREGLGPPCWPRQGPGRPTLGAAGEARRARLSVRGPPRANGCLSVFVS